MPLQLILVSKLLSILALLQSAEYLRLTRETSNVWRWEDLKEDFPDGWSRSLLKICFQPRSFFILNLLRIFLALWFFSSPQFMGAAGLLVLHVLTLLRFRGTFNGGSDYMNWMLLMCVSIALAAGDHPKVVAGALWYIAIQVCLSYSKAGVSKLRHKPWQTGSALKEFINSPVYQSGPWLTALSQNSVLTCGLSWLIMIFEITFPLSLIHSHIAAVYMILGVAFHLANTYLFGLNRFFFAWLAAYPALI